MKKVVRTLPEYIYQLRPNTRKSIDLKEALNVLVELNLRGTTDIVETQRTHEQHLNLAQVRTDKTCKHLIYCFERMEVMNKWYRYDIEQHPSGFSL